MIIRAVSISACVVLVCVIGLMFLYMDDGLNDNREMLVPALKDVVRINGREVETRKSYLGVGIVVGLVLISICVIISLLSNIGGKINAGSRICIKKYCRIYIASINTDVHLGYQITFKDYHYFEGEAINQKERFPSLEKYISKYIESVNDKSDNEVIEKRIVDVICIMRSRIKVNLDVIDKCIRKDKSKFEDITQGNIRDAILCLGCCINTYIFTISETTVTDMFSPYINFDIEELSKLFEFFLYSKGVPYFYARSILKDILNGKDDINIRGIILELPHTYEEVEKVIKYFCRASMYRNRSYIHTQSPETKLMKGFSGIVKNDFKYVNVEGSSKKEAISDVMLILEVRDLILSILEETGFSTIQINYGTPKDIDSYFRSPKSK